MFDYRSIVGTFFPLIISSPRYMFMFYYAAEREGEGVLGGGGGCRRSASWRKREKTIGPI